ncbi:uncharacterized protein [Nicotiana tomentosiformis]|uniref:uncharacterized protein n=1 Tax=Nicotiana tomentosiformis TaxID=4098 RepID=UPI00388C63E1
MAVENKATEYDSIFALMEKSDEDEDDNDDEKLVSLENVLIDAYYNLINDKNTLTEEIGEVENEKDELLVVVVDLRETIEEFKKEKDALAKKIEEVENERDDLVVVVVDLKETIEELKGENNSVKAQIENFLNLSKGKEVAIEAHIRLEDELQKTKLSLCAELERNRQLQEDLNKWGKIQNIYVLGFESLNSGDLTCLSIVDDDAELWHERLGHASFMLLNKLVKKDLVRGLPKLKFQDHKIQVKMSHNVIGIRSDHGTEFDNAKFDEF